VRFYDSDMTLLHASALPLAIFAAATLWLGWVDARTRRIPHRAVLLFTGGLFSAFVVTAVQHQTFQRLAIAVVCGICLFGLSLLISVVNPRVLGGGDVKLCALIGCALGWFGWSTVVLGIALTVVFVAAVSLIVFQRSEGHVRTVTVPVAPIVFLASWIALSCVAALSEDAHI
jgi:leader peptidase (prepilin peptidase)/N-methyltransferase